MKDKVLTQGRYSLLKDSIPIEDIPIYPTFEYKVASEKGVPSNKMVIPESGIPYTDPCFAKKGERIRDPEMRYLADVSKNLDFRIERALLCSKDHAYRELEMKYCASSILYFCNVYCWTHNPYGDEEHRDNPFVTYPFQDEWLLWRVWCLDRRLDNLTEKSREQGLSWLIQVFHVWLCLFYKGTTTYQVSMKEASVDNRTVDSLLGKARYLLGKLPEWMRAGWGERNPLYDKKMMIMFPDTESVIKGELTSTAGRGGRATVADFDEFAHVDGSEAVAESCSSLAGSISYISTVNGMGNYFAKMAHRKGTHKKSFHYTDHPMKTKEWVLIEKSKPKYAEESVWAQEHEIDYHKSKSGRVFPSFRYEDDEEGVWSHVQKDKWYAYNPHFPVYVGMDLGVGDPSSAVFFQKREAHHSVKSHTEWTWVMFDYKEDKQADWGVDEWKQYYNQLILEGMRIEGIILDPRTGRAKQMNRRTWHQEFEEYGLPVVHNARSNEISTLTNMKALLKRPGRFCIYLYNCGWPVEAFQNWSYDKIDVDSKGVHPDAKPKHDKYSHNMKATLYLMDHYDNELKRSENEQQSRKYRDRLERWSFQL